MGGRSGRKPPALKGQYDIHLIKVYDMRDPEKPILRYAYYSNGEWVDNSCKHKALELSIQANCDDPNWRPPSEWYKEGYILAIDKENVPAP